MRFVKLVDVCANITDGSHYSPKSDEGGLFPYVTVRDIVNDVIDFGNCKQISESHYDDLKKNGCNPVSGDLLFSKDGTVGKVSLINFDKEFVVLSSLAIIRPDQNIILPEYLFYILKSDYFLDQAVGKKSGTAIRRIVLRDLKNIEIRIHETLEEQRRVVERLDAAFEKIDRVIELVDININNAKTYPTRWLQNIFSEKSRDWETAALKEIAHFKGGGTPSKSNPDFWEGSIPWVSPKDMKSRYITDSIDHISQSALDNSSTTLVPADSILLVVRSGILAHTIPLAINKVDVTLNQDMKAFIPKKGVRTDFLFVVLDALREEISTYVSKGATVHRINTDQLKELAIKYPASDLEQKEFAEVCNSVISRSHKLSDLYVAKRKSLLKLKQSMLTQAFSRSDVE